LQDRIHGRADGIAPVSVHFVNNVLAAAASYIEEDPETARDVLAELGSFLSHRLRGPRLVSTGEELDHVAVYLRLEQARFPERVEVELPASADLPTARVAPGRGSRPATCRGRSATRSSAGSRAGRGACAWRCAPAPTASTSSSTTQTSPARPASDCASGSDCRPRRP
jgi:hypothetical protein